MRTQADCVSILSAITQLNPNELALLFGLIGGEYIKAPNSVFWDVLHKFFQGRPSI